MTRKRSRRATLAAETIRVLDHGYYDVPKSGRVEIGHLIAKCVSETKHYDPNALEKIKKEIVSQRVKQGITRIEVNNETTLCGASRLANTGLYERIGVLNFASAKNPGGGFLRGSQAQEESLARSSALYKSLLQASQYYEYHRTNNSLLYSDRIIYSPRCPVIRNDEGDLLARPYLVDFITCPAPNAGAIRRNTPALIPKIEQSICERSSSLLCLAAYRMCDALVLGAWGCGVFQNDPDTVSSAFHSALGRGGMLRGRFRMIVFSVLDNSKDQSTYRSFSGKFTR